MAARPDNLHSRLVGWLKLLLPLAALVVLSTLFLVARTIDPSDAIPAAGVDVEDRVRAPRMTSPAWAGVTRDGTALAIEASEFRPDEGAGGDAAAQDVRADIDTPDGNSARLVSQTARVEGAARLLHFGGGVTIDTSSGYRIRTEAMTSAMDRTDIRSDTALVATGPIGDIAAGSMRLTESGQQPGRYLLGFGNRVKLTYDPQK